MVGAKPRSSMNPATKSYTSRCLGVNAIFANLVTHEPIDVVAHHVYIARDGQHFSAATPTPGLNLSNFVTIQQNAVMPTPPAHRFDLAARLDSYLRMNRLQQSHGIHTPLLVFLLLKRSNLTTEVIRKSPKIVKQKVRRGSTG